MKKIILSLILILNVSLMYAESPGSFRGKETHGIGLGIESTAGSLFYDYAINSDMQIHAMATSGGICRADFYATLCSDSSTIGATLRYFPSENYGFFVGGGGGMLSASQSLKQTIYCSSSRASSSDPIECSGKAYSYISGSADSTYSGIALWGDFGWQGYDGYYFTIGAKAGTSMKLSEDDKTDEAIDIYDHKSYTKSDWESMKSPTGLIMSFGWHF